MIVDSSALLAIIFDEGDGEQYIRALLRGRPLRMSAANWLEAAMVVDGRNSAAASVRFEDFMQRLRIEIVPVTVEHAYRARTARREYGRGNHSARLNYGDCFAYALAKLTGEALLFEGSDFSQTDIEPALRA